MSDAEQDAVIGRMVKEHADNKRKLAAMTSELARYEKAFKALANSLSANDAPDFNQRCVTRDIGMHPILENLGLSTLLSFMEEYTQLRQTVNSGIARLRDIGV